MIEFVLSSVQSGDGATVDPSMLDDTDLSDNYAAYNGALQTYTWTNDAPGTSFGFHVPQTSDAYFVQPIQIEF